MESAISRPLPLKAKTLPGAGSTAGDAQAMRMRRHVAREHVVAVLPQQLAGVGVQGHQPFLRRRAGADGVLEVEAIAEHDRRRSLAVRDLPSEVLTRRRPRRGQIGFGRDAVSGDRAIRASRSAPGGPAQAEQRAP